MLWTECLFLPKLILWSPQVCYLGNPTYDHCISNSRTISQRFRIRLSDFQESHHFSPWVTPLQAQQSCRGREKIALHREKKKCDIVWTKGIVNFSFWGGKLWVLGFGIMQEAKQLTDSTTKGGLWDVASLEAALTTEELTNLLKWPKKIMVWWIPRSDEHCQIRSLMCLTFALYYSRMLINYWGQCFPNFNVHKNRLGFFLKLRLWFRRSWVRPEILQF